MINFGKHTNQIINANKKKKKRNLSVIRQLIGATRKVCVICQVKQCNAMLHHGDSAHLCACYECAHKCNTQSGKCPLCRAPIDGIIFTYTDPQESDHKCISHPIPGTDVILANLTIYCSNAEE